MDVYKQPVTDPSKGSKRGRLCLRRNSDGFIETVESGAGKPQEVRSALFATSLPIISQIFPKDMNILCHIFAFIKLFFSILNFSDTYR